MTSHDVIDYLRRISIERTIGHAGTLDPNASGLLLVAIGREYTKRLQEFVGLDKEYEADISLGKISTTYDAEGELSPISTYQPSLHEINHAFEKLTGKIEQKPPIFSAKKIQGQKAYDLARRGEEVDLKPMVVTIYKIELVSYQYPILKIRVRVSSGTYIRSLAHDLGQILGTGAYLYDLVRTSIGQYNLNKSLVLRKIKTMEDLEECRILLQ